MNEFGFKDVDFCKWGFKSRNWTRLWNNLKSWKPRPLCKKDCGQMEGNSHTCKETAQEESPVTKRKLGQKTILYSRKETTYRIPAEELIREMMNGHMEDDMVDDMGKILAEWSFDAEDGEWFGAMQWWNIDGWKWSIEPSIKAFLHYYKKGWFHVVPKIITPHNHCESKNQLSLGWNRVEPMVLRSSSHSYRFWEDQQTHTRRTHTYYIYIVLKNVYSKYVKPPKNMPHSETTPSQEPDPFPWRPRLP